MCPMFSTFVDLTRSTCSQCSMLLHSQTFAPFDTTPLLIPHPFWKPSSFKRTKLRKQSSLMATEASERKVLVNARCVVNEQIDIHDNADACIILPLFCEKNRCLLSGAAVSSHWLGLWWHWLGLWQWPGLAWPLTRSSISKLVFVLWFQWLSPSWVTCHECSHWCKWSSSLRFSAHASNITQLCRM